MPSATTRWPRAASRSCRVLAAAREECSKLTFDAGLVLHEYDIEQLHERRIKALGAREDLPARRAELASAEADLRRLARDEAVVTPGELARARKHCDAGWSLIRRRYVEAVPISDAEIGAFAGADAGAGTLRDQPPAVVLEAAGEVLARHERLAERRRELDRAYRTATTDEAHRRNVREKTEAARSEWRSQWADALTALGFDPMTEPEAIVPRLDVIDEMRDHVTRINDLRHERIGKIEGYVAAFAQDVRQLAATVAPDLTRLKPEEAALRTTGIWWTSCAPPLGGTVPVVELGEVARA